jgi:RNA polymerase I-specific transcription initiation factor RRN3
LFCFRYFSDLFKGPEIYTEITCETIFDYTHTALIKILQLIPRGPGILLPILSQKLPHKSDSVIVQKLYVKSLLYIAEYAPMIRNELIQLVLELIVQIDVCNFYLFQG